MLQSMGSQRVGHDLATEQQQQGSVKALFLNHVFQASLVTYEHIVMQK